MQILIGIHLSYKKLHKCNFILLKASRVLLAKMIGWFLGTNWYWCSGFGQRAICKYWKNFLVGLLEGIIFWIVGEAMNIFNLHIHCINNFVINLYVMNRLNELTKYPIKLILIYLA